MLTKKNLRAIVKEMHIIYVISCPFKSSPSSALWQENAAAYNPIADYATEIIPRPLIGYTDVTTVSLWNVYFLIVFLRVCEVIFSKFLIVIDNF